MKNKQFWVKVMVWILAVLMIGSCALVLFQACALSTAAAEVETVAEEAPEYITVGLMYGSDVTVGFETVTTVGFSVYAVTATRTERSFEEIYTVDIPKISVVCDGNLSQTAYTYSIYDGTKSCVVGGYHLEVAEDFEKREDADAMLSTVKEWLNKEGSNMHPFIAYINGVYKVRVSDCSDAARAENKLATVPNMAAEIEFDVVEPSKTALTIVDPETNVIYFEYDDGGNRALGLSAMDKEGKKQYLKTPANRLYDGIFMYERYIADTVSGVALTNMLPLEDYIAGVVPYEISPSWPYEALRAFAITVRSYTVQNKNRHYTSYGFDICNTTHCQVYRGIGSANDNVYKAVESTKGLVLSDGKSIVTTYYSSSTGGYTSSAKDTWGGDDSPYLVPTYTPWERYSEHASGLWVSEVSGTELAAYLQSKGYNIGSEIVDIKINEFSGDSPYVYSITYTDAGGKQLTITRCDKVRTSISKYVNSANFVVGKGTLTYEYDDVVDIDINGTYSSTTGNYSTVSEEEETVKVLTANGIEEVKPTKNVYVQKSDDVARISLDTLQIATGMSGYYYNLNSTPGVILHRITETVEAADENNFIFAGKGWGHGVGLSQYGIYDLAVAGATAEQILLLYFPSLSLLDYHEVK
ncbi:MAG: SpoIID/LytB domain-containing protein [Clostridia bacterium]|nr:SpoIID/LytB domain-containing protein [Clostridia bacterium]